MIDFIDVTIPFQNDGEINNGYKDSCQKDRPSNRKFFFVPIRNENGARMQVMSVGTSHMRIIGNPAKFIQNQNLFG
ncbi:MAG: phage/plasmid replication domain-containing protein, partial [Methanobacterium sp.]